MIRDRLIICIASSWDYDPTSKHHLMRVLSGGNKILWVNYHGTRRPGVTPWDIRDSFSAIARVARGLRPISPTMWQLTPLVIPGATSRILQELHRRLLVEQLQQALRQVDPARHMPVQVWTFAPDVHYLRGAFQEECFVYYCVDDYTKFAGFNSAAITELETQLLRTADLAIATSKPLCESKKKVRPDIEYIPHGVDFAHFASALNEEPADIRAIRRPIFGFFGLIHHWFDLELIARVAQLRPDYSFVLVGDCKVDARSLQLPNIHLLGRRPYSTLPAYCRAFSAGLVPFVRNDMTRCINPIKLMEYLAAGLPVISTSLPAAREFEDAVTVADTSDDFAAACDRVLRQPLDRAHISELVSGNTWEARAEKVSQLVSACTRPRSVIKPEPVDPPMGRRYWQPFEPVLRYPSG